MFKFFKNLFTRNNEDVTIEDKKLVFGEETVIRVPEMKDVNDLKLKKWNFQNGDIVSDGASVCVIENETVHIEFDIEGGGKLIHLCEEGTNLKTDQAIFKIVEVLNH